MYAITIKRILCPVSVIISIIGIFFCSTSYAAVVVNDITKLNPITVDQVITPHSVEEISKLVAAHNGSISIGGGRYSQGGQTATENALFIDMRSMDKILKLDTEKRQITVQTGITWRKIQEFIDPKGLSIKIMQTYSNFTVGGSLSVNVHGRYVGEGPIIRSVESIKIILADGSVKEASRTKNPELFFAAIGGYGGIGVIVEATLNLAENTHVERSNKIMDITQYKDFFFSNIKGSKTAVFHNADIYPPNYSQVNVVTWNATDKPVTVPEKLAPQDKLTYSQQMFLSLFSSGNFGKWCRQHLYDSYLYSDDVVEWRNYEASYDVAGLEPLSRDKETYVLQEYFIPVDKFDNFVPKMAKILQENNVNALNVSIRHALPDPGSLLAWAKQEMFAFVIYYKQGVTDEDKKAVYNWTGKLIDAALSEGGSYYLPYQIIASKEQFLKAYPRANEYFSVKRKFDPTYKFRNKLWDKYYTEKE